jgi:CubicO group peptidase (beta-lactamase class C family)
MKQSSWLLSLLLILSPAALNAEEARSESIRLAEDNKASRQSMQALLDRYHVPGLSLAVIEKGKIAWTRGYGVVTPGGKPISAETRFQAGSVSKPVAALGTLRLVERGKLALDEDLNRFLVSWKVPDNEFTAKKSVTLREALSHTGGFIQPSEGWRGYAASERVPTLVQVLRGEPPANSPAAVVDMLPGSKFRYSNCGYLAIQQAVIDVTGKPFPKVMETFVFNPLRMQCSTFEQPAPADFDAIAAVGHDRDGKPIEGKWHTYPEMAAAGLWTTAGDLARFIIGVQHACHGEHDAVLGTQLCRQMLTPQVPDAPFEDSYGLGFQIGGHGPRQFFWHGGGTAGFYSYFVGYVETGQGAVILANGKNSGELIQIVIRSIAKEYGWSNKAAPKQP